MNLTLEFYNKNLWVEAGRWIQTPFPNFFFGLWYTTNAVKNVLPGIKFHTIFFIDHYAFLYKEDVENIYTLSKKKYKENTLQDIAHALDKSGKESFANLLDFLKNSDEYILENIEKFFQLYLEFVGVWSMASYIGDVPTRLATEVNYVSSEAELFAHVHPYLRETWIEEEVKDTVQIAKEFIKTYPESSESISNVIDSDKNLTKLVENYIEKYSWSRVVKWIGEPIDKYYVYKRIAEEIQNVKLGNHIQAKHTNIDEQKLDGIVQLSLSTAYWRAESTKIEMFTSLRLREILKMIGKKNGMTYEQVILLSPNELLMVMRNNDYKIENKEKVLERQGEYLCTVLENGEQIVLTSTSPDFAELKKNFLTPTAKVENDGTLKGVAACPGFAKGVVRVVEGQKDFASFKEGEILVSDQTTPSFVPLMRMAAAIVTGKGGITSHAAIVSRELKKPCVIAIKEVNRILKTGDLIEVDATKGIVRIIK